MTKHSLIEDLEDRAGENYRATVRYNGDETEILYVREDLEETRLTSQTDRIVRRLRPETSSKEEASFPFGDLAATVRVFHDAILLHFPRGKNRGIFVSLEPETARSLTTFISECEKRLQN